MSVRLVVTGGFGNGVFDGSTSSIVVDGFLPVAPAVAAQSDPLATLLLSASGVAGLLRVNRIEQQGHINVDADNTPWIGIYRPGPSDVGLRLGDISDWEQKETVQVIAQATSYLSGADCEQRLDNIVSPVIEAVKSDTTILNSVENIDEISVNYEYDYSERESLHFQTATIDLMTVKKISYS